ncbi:hypothetical protein ARZXY2_1303 [Arthrobacter sp. ZXY-2]|nr:hypothetical protein ARZXY2_1303 [Arthrobacter sp. ZXY-2]
MSLVQQLEPAAEVQPAAGLPGAARILAEAYPQIVDFDPSGMTIEEVHYFLGESAAVAFFQFLVLTKRCKAAVGIRR